MIPINTKVKVTRESIYHAAYPGDEGYVVAVQVTYSGEEYGVNFTSGYLSRERGHNLDGRLEKDTGNWIPVTDLEIIC